MKKYIIPMMAIAYLISSCGADSSSRNIEPSSTTVSADSTNYQELTQSSGKDKVAEYGPNRKFVQSVTMDFQSKDAINSMKQIETIAKQQKGMVILSDLKNNVNEEVSQPVGTDSILKIKNYSILVTMTIRIPSALLDTTLNEIDRQVAFLDNRHRTMGDVSIQYKQNALNTQRNAQNAAKLNSSHTIKGIEANDEYSTERDNNILAQDQLMDNVNFTDVQLSFQQDNVINKIVVANPKSVVSLGIGWKIVDALKTGGTYLVNAAIALLYLWPLWLIMGFGYFIYKKFISRKKKIIHE